MKENRTELRASERSKKEVSETNASLRASERCEKEIYVDMFLRVMKEEKILTEEEYIKAKRRIGK